MTAKIFISFASKDVKVAQTLCAALESRGIHCWISARDIQPGENFQVSIVRALRQAKIMLLVFTHNSNSSEEMTKELALASQQKLIVIPLRVEDVTPGDAFAYEFATRQWIDVFADWESSIDQLCRRITLALEGLEPAPEPAPVVLEAAAELEAEPEVAAAGPPAEPVLLEEPTPVANDEAPEAAAASNDDAEVELAETGAKRPRIARIALLAAGLAVAIGLGVAGPLLFQNKAHQAAPQVASRPDGLINTANVGASAGQAAAAPLAAVALTETPPPTPRAKRKAPKREADTDIPY